MPLVRLDRPDDPRAVEYSLVPDAALLRTRGLFVAEGRLVVGRLLADPRYRVRSLLLNEASYRSLQPALSALSPAIPIYLCDTAYFEGITGFPLHRGCLALADRPTQLALVDLLSMARLIVVLEGVTNADNVGGVFRNAAAFGVDAVLFSPTTCDPLYRKAIRTSMGAVLQVPFRRLEDWPDELVTLRSRGFALVALTLRQPSMRLDDFVAGTHRPQRVALLVGTEATGLTGPAERAADHHVHIPMTDAVDSLNLSVATGIALSRLSGRAAI